MSQEVPKRPPRRSKRISRRPKGTLGPSWRPWGLAQDANIVQKNMCRKLTFSVLRAFKTAQEALKIAPRRPPRPPRRSQEGPKRGSTNRKFEPSARRPQEAPRGPQEIPGSPQEVPRRLQEAPKRPQKDPKRPQNGPQEASKLLPRGPREAYHEIPTKTPDASDVQPRHGGGIGRTLKLSFLEGVGGMA